MWEGEGVRQNHKNGIAWIRCYLIALVDNVVMRACGSSPRRPHISQDTGGYFGGNMNKNIYPFSICCWWLHHVWSGSQATLEKSNTHRRVFWRFGGDVIPFWQWSTSIHDGIILEWTKNGNDMRLVSIGTPYTLDKKGIFRKWNPAASRWDIVQHIGLDRHVSVTRNLFMNTVECGIVFEGVNNAK